MAVHPSNADILADPAWLAHRYDAEHDAVRFTHIPRAMHRGATFLTDEYLKPPPAVRAIARAEAMANRPPSAPLHYIFHSAFCGSTVLARALDIEGVAMGLKEPPILNDLVGWRHRGATGAEVARGLDAALTLLARPFEPGEALIIKPSNVIVGLMEAMIALRPEARAVLLYAPLPVYLRSIAKKGIDGRLWVRDLLAKLLRERLIDLGLSGEDYLRLTDLQSAAVGWLAQQMLFARLSAKYPARIRALDSETLMARPRDVMAALGAFYGLMLNADEIATGPAFTRHSKHGAQFDAAARTAEYAAAAAAHGDELMKVEVWAEALAKAAGVETGTARNAPVSLTFGEVQALRSAAERHLTSGDMGAAIDSYRHLLAESPARADDWYNLGYALRISRRYAEALDAYGTALARGIAQPEAVHVNRAAIFAEHLQRPAEAKAELESALAVSPRFQIAALNLGQLYEDTDDRAAARQVYADVLAHDPANARAQARLAALDVLEGDASGAVDRLTPLLARQRLPDDAAELGFALGNALDAAGRYDTAFAAFKDANEAALLASRVRYDPKVQDRLIDAIIAAFPQAGASSATDGDMPRPLFICGMFRSGSTLCEQVLARHSRVTAGGELETLPALVESLAPYPEAAATLGQASVSALGKQYRAELSSLFPGADIVTDKRCDNFLHIGLIKAMMPGATIVHSQRAAIDNALSVWFLHFADSISYGWRLDDIAHYYRAYRRLMAHWQRLYPDIVTFHYDAFVASPQTEARALLSACSLEWEPGCDPSRAVTGEVRTGSAWQVRQPVHARSAGRWRNYAADIGDLEKALRID